MSAAVVSQCKICYMFLYKKIRVSSQLPSSRARSFDISRPAAENWHSDCTDVAGTDKYSLARVAVAR